MSHMESRGLGSLARGRGALGGCLDGELGRGLCSWAQTALREGPSSQLPVAGGALPAPAREGLQLRRAQAAPLFAALLGLAAGSGPQCSGAALPGPGWQQDRAGRGARPHVAPRVAARERETDPGAARGGNGGARGACAGRAAPCGPGPRSHSAPRRGARSPRVRATRGDAAAAAHGAGAGAVQQPPEAPQPRAGGAGAPVPHGRTAVPGGGLGSCAVMTLPGTPGSPVMSWARLPSAVPWLGEADLGPGPGPGTERRPFPRAAAALSARLRAPAPAGPEKPRLPRAEGGGREPRSAGAD